METFVRTLDSVSPLAAGVLLASIWQGLLLTAGVALAVRGLRGVSASVRTWIWTAVLVLVVLLPVVATAVPHAVAAGHTKLHVAADWSVGLLAAWAFLALLRGAVLVANAVRLWRLARRATPVEAGADVAALLRGPRRAVLCVSAEVNRPSVAGFFRPRVLLPAGLLETLSSAELEHVVLHEMEHLRRWDDWLNLVQQISLVLLPLNPAIVWLDRQLCRERELACDDRVLAATRANKAYAACLVKLAEDSLVRKGFALALSALGTRARESELVGRVRRILAGPEQGGRPGRVRFAVSALAVGVLAGVGLLARSPELVSFDETPQVMAQVQAPRSPVLGGSFALPVASRVQEMTSAGLYGRGARTVAATMNGASGFRPVLAAAVVRGGAGMPRRVAAVATVRRRANLRKVPLKAALQQPWSVVPGKMASAEVAAPFRAVPVKAAMDGDSRPEVVPVATPASFPAARVVVTEFEFSQPVFAAVPVRGGWLILQL